MWSQLTRLPSNAKVAVVGSGVSGLMFTYFLGKLRPDVSINIYESSKRCGGWINSWHTNDQNGDPIMLEKGPRTLRGVSDGTVLMMDTLRDLGKEDIIQCIEGTSEANRKFLLDTNNKLIQTPSSISSFAKFLLNPLGKGIIGGMLSEYFRKAPAKKVTDESVSSFIKRRFGNDYISKNLLSAIFRGIYADNVDTLSARKTLRDMCSLEDNYGSIFRGTWKRQQQKNLDKGNISTQPALNGCLNEYQTVFGKDKTDLVNLSKSLKKYPMLGLKGGLGEFPNLVRNAVAKLPNVHIRLGEEVVKVQNEQEPNQISIKLATGEAVTGFDHVRVTTIPSKMSEFVRDENEQLANELQSVKPNTVLLVNYYLPGKDVIDHEYHGFGYLVPKSNKNPQNLLGVIFDSVIEKNFKQFNNNVINPSGNQLSEYTKVTAMLGGYLLAQRSHCSIPSKELVIKSVKDALESHLFISRQDLDNGLWQYTIADTCLPHFFVGYDNWQSKIEQQLLETYKSKLSVGGMGFSKGPGVPDVVVDSFQDAMKLK